MSRLETVLSPVMTLGLLDTAMPEVDYPFAFQICEPIASSSGLNQLEFFFPWTSERLFINIKIWINVLLMAGKWCSSSVN
jgi:hypothetical protein